MRVFDLCRIAESGITRIPDLAHAATLVILRLRREICVGIRNASQRTEPAFHPRDIRARRHTGIRPTSGGATKQWAEFVV